MTKQHPDLMHLKIKVCGMRDPKNIAEALTLPIDFMGFIFYEKSPRYVAENTNTNNFGAVKRVGVFVNASTDFIRQKIDTHQLDYLQLHGDETPEYCQNLQSKIGTTQLIRAFRVDDNFDFETVKPYEKYCTYFIFDTKKTAVKGSEQEYGGTGEKFNWQILQQYTHKTPFLLSGGIGAADVETIQNFSHPQLAGLDLNSKFEDQPALKNIQKLKAFLQAIQQ